MTEVRYSPRKIDLETLIKVLVEEHVTMKEGLRRAKQAADRKDFEAVSRALKEVNPVFRQHIADEESQVLRLLIAQLGVKGAAEEIKVFQQHRPIYQLMEKVKELAAVSPAELEVDQARLDSLFDDHTLAEEQRVFPRALALRRKAKG